MKKLKLLSIVITLTVVGWFILSSAVIGKSALEPLEGSDVDSEQIKSVMIEGWESKNPADKWRMKTNPTGNLVFNTKIENRDGFPRSLAHMNRGNGGKLKLNQKSLGFSFQFVYPGNNTVEILPPKNRRVRKYLGQLDGNQKPKFIDIDGIELPGKVKAVSVWVLGRGNNYNLECWIQDWKGDTHIYQFGNLDFVGWRPMMVRIPKTVPQDVKSFPQTKTLIFQKFVIRSTNKSTQEKVVVFFDSLKILSDVFDVFFDGADMDLDDNDKAIKNFYGQYLKILEAYSTGQKYNGKEVDFEKIYSSMVKSKFSKGKN